MSLGDPDTFVATPPEGGGGMQPMEEPQEDLSEDLQSWSVNAPYDDDGETSASERGRPSRPMASKAKQTEPLSDEEGDSEGEPTEDLEEVPSRQTDSHSRMVRKLAQRDREMTQLRARERDLQRQLQQAQQLQQSNREPDDIIELARHRLARSFGTNDVNDPRVKEALFELSRDITLEHLGAAADKDPELRKIREQRAEQRRRDADRRGLEERIERMERDRQEADRRSEQTQVMSTLNRIIQNDARHLPFLLAQTDVDPAETVFELVQEAVRTGQAPIPRTNDPAEADRLAIKFARDIAKRLDTHYRGLAEVLASKLNPPEDDEADEDAQQVAKKVRSQLSNRVQTKTAPKAAKMQQAPKRRTGATGTGGGGRGRAPEQSNVVASDEPDSMSDWWRQQHDIEMAGRRGRR